MKQLTMNELRKTEPCYDPAKYAAEDWTGTVLDILKAENVPPQDRIWLATHFIDDKTNRLFAVWCAREALKLVPNPDPRSVAACDVAERFANGLATDEELRTAAAAAWTATAWARTAAEAAAGAWAAAAAGAWAAAAAEAAWAARTAAAAEAAWAAAGAAARVAQVKQLIAMIEAKETTNGTP
jgi:hypothetical protein